MPSYAHGYMAQKDAAMTQMMPHFPFQLHFDSLALYNTLSLGKHRHHHTNILILPLFSPLTTPFHGKTWQFLGNDEFLRVGSE